MNQEQQDVVQAVVEEDKNVILQAPPGTGKTEVLAQICASIINRQKAIPWEIIVLCFTKAAVNSMIERLYEIVGQTVGSQIKVCTLHKWALEITQGVFKGYSQASDHEIKDIVNRVKGPLTVYDTKQVFTWMETLGMTDATAHALKELDKFTETAKQDSEYTYERSNKNGKKGELRYDVVAKIEKLRDTIKCYQGFRDLLSERKRWTHAGNINAAIRN